MRLLPSLLPKFRLVLPVALLLAGCMGGSAPALQAEQGVLDLTGARLDDIIPLKGEWLAQSGVDSSAFARYEYDDSDWQAVLVESYFREHGFPDEGLAWYRLHLRLPPDAPPLKGFLQHANNAHVIYAARPGEPPQKLAESGRPALSARETTLSRKPVTFVLPAGTDLVLAWKIANHDYLNGGPFYAIEIGPAEAIDRMVLGQTAMAFLCYGLYILIASFFLLNWAMHRDDRQSLAIGLLSLVMAVRSVSISGSLELLLPGVVDFPVRILIAAGTFLALNGLLGFLLWSFFPLEFAALPFGIRVGLDPNVRQPKDGLLPRWVRNANTAAVLVAWVTSAVFVIITVVSSPHVTSYAMAWARWISLALAVPAAVVIGAAVYFERPLARSMAFGMALIIGGGIHDILLAEGVVKGHPYVVTYAFVGFVLVQSFALVRRNAYHALLVHRNAESLREQVEHRTKELRAATIAAHAANLAKGQFLSAVSHELRTPLASILGYTEILQDEMDKDLKPQQREFFHIIEVSARRLLMLVNDLLDMAKIEAGRLSLHIDAVDLRAVIKEVIDQTYPLAREKELALDTHIDEESPFVRADWMRLRQVLLNLLSNAIKFTESGGIVVRVYSVEHKGQPAVAVAVRDTGRGISDDFLPHLFERFAQDQRAYERTQRGTGLGLTISRELVERMGGCISVETMPGEGSTFTVVLLRAEVEATRVEGAATLEGDGQSV